MKPTYVSLQLADKPYKYQIGVLEDVLVKLGHLYIPTDFIIMEIKEDSQVPIIFCQPLLNIVGEIIDVKKGRLALLVGNKKIGFIKYILKDPYTKFSCYVIETCEKPSLKTRHLSKNKTHLHRSRSMSHPLKKEKME